jgi:3-oxoadipate enol-lactonase
MDMRSMPTAVRYDVDGVELSYRDVGSRPSAAGTEVAVVLIHGLGGSPDDWVAQLQVVADIRCVVPDLRGFGESAAAPGPFTVERYAEDLTRLLDHLELGVVDLVGHSMGGAVALQMTLDHPDRVRGLMLVNSLADFRVRGIGRWIEYGLRRFVIALFGRGVLARLLLRRNYPRADQAEIREMLAARPLSGRTEVYLNAMRALIDWSVSERLHEVKVPTTVVSGELDLTPVSEKAELAERIPNAELEVVVGSRHGTPIGAADAFNTLLMAFLAASSGSEEDVSR